MSNIKTENQLKQKNNGLKAQAKVLNQTALEVGNDLVEVALKGGKASQQIFGKVLNGGLTILGMQQAMALSALEQMAEKVEGNDQLKKIVGVSATYFNQIKKATEAATSKVKTTVTGTAAAVKEEVTEAVNEVAEDLEVVETVAVAAKEELLGAVGKAKQQFVAAVENVVKTAKVEMAEGEDDLQKIDGIGPKMAEVLKEAGITNFVQIANSKVEDLEAILAEAGSTYKRFNPAPWIEQAKFAVVGDWEGLNAWLEANK